ncbi:helix-turn-helix domain-containing protein [Paenibacillus mendelii]|uniref:Helix-turn-helix domain-containing protein n=1 Tax=Paenibacillus mendelii TaxID=206163 RepID=A0ABV6J8B1_9BACL|nr:AraC family transcriptional regulator [Paenibacillus mendelii]
MELEKLLSHREPMDMPDPLFPIKLHRTHANEYGSLLFNHHWHEHIEFLFFIEGEAMIECNSERLYVSAGDLVVLNSTDLHHGINLSDNLFYFAVIADPSLLHSRSVDAVEMKYITPITQNRISFQNKITNDPEINSCIRSLIEEYEKREYGYELAVKSDLYRLLSILLRKYIVRLLKPNEYELRRKNLERFDPIYEYIEENYQSKIMVEDLAKQVNMSRFYFCRLFKEITNKTISEYVNFVRINKSEYLLRNTSMSISEIALATGFNDIYYFSRLFKTYKKVSPSKIRRNPGEM